jgi:uncharacterized paraquat-inducible protein A
MEVLYLKNENKIAHWKITHITDPPQLGKYGTIETKTHDTIECSNCHCGWIVSKLAYKSYRYCPNCGAKMEEEIEEYFKENCNLIKR